MREFAVSPTLIPRQVSCPTLLSDERDELGPPQSLLLSLCSWNQLEREAKTVFPQTCVSYRSQKVLVKTASSAGIPE